MAAVRACIVDPKAAATHKELSVETPLFKFRAGSQLFERQSDPQVQRDLFSKYVKRIVIETSSYCNRRCVFCPNTDGSRIKARFSMPADVFRSVINDLAEIDFAGLVLFHLYNEPLADPDIFSRIAYARAKLPKASLSFNSNGDYIRPETLTRLVQVGLNKLHISIYGPEHGRYDKDYVFSRVEEMGKLCGLSLQPSWVSDTECRLVDTFQDSGLSLPIIIQARDFNLAGYDRGGLVSFETQATPDRLYPCPSPFDELLLTWNGVAVPCCNVVGDRPEHQAYTVGTVKKDRSIFDVYANGPLVDWRRSLIKFSEKKAPCAQCTRLSSPMTELSADHQAFNDEVDAFLPARSDLPAQKATA